MIINLKFTVFEVSLLITLLDKSIKDSKNKMNTATRCRMRRKFKKAIEENRIERIKQIGIEDYGL